MRNLSCIAFLAFTVAVSFTSPSLVSAQAPTPTNGITVAPAFVTVQVGSLQPEVTVSVGVRNDFSTPITLSAALSGLDVQNNTLIPSNQTNNALQKSTTITPSVFELKPKESKNIQVTVKNNPELSPGGQYLALLVQQVSNDSQQLSLNAAISASIYVIKEDGALRKIAINKLDIKRNLFSLPQSADIVFANTGNVTSVPRGLVTVSSRDGSTNYAQGVINNGSIPLYPRQEITLRSELENVRRAILPGRYQLAVEYRYEGQEATTVASTYFWYVPKLFIFIIPTLIAFMYSTRIIKQRINTKKRLDSAGKVSHSTPASILPKQQLPKAQPISNPSDNSTSNADAPKAKKIKIIVNDQADDSK